MKCRTGRRPQKLKDKGRFWVGLSYEFQAYGGPEEGGWYYSACTPTDGRYENNIPYGLRKPRHFRSRENATAYSNRLWKLVDRLNKGRVPPWSTRYSGGYLAVSYYEEMKPHDTPRKQPHYS
jgi:hypothetical protein